MGRPSNRDARRAGILRALAAVVADGGVGGATIARVAERAGVAPGLVHHHFDDKAEMIDALLTRLIAGFRARAHEEAQGAGGDRVLAYGMAALSLGRGADPVAARAWVGVLAEALRQPALFGRVRRLLDAEVDTLRERSGWKLSEADASAIVAFVLGALMFGAFAPRKAAGFAAPAMQKLVAALRVSSVGT